MTEILAWALVGAELAVIVALLLRKPRTAAPPARPPLEPVVPPAEEQRRAERDAAIAEASKASELDEVMGRKR